MMFCVSCIFHLNYPIKDLDKLNYIWMQHYQRLSRIVHYQLQGNIIYTIDSKKKTYFNFFLDHKNNNHYTIKLLNIFGVTILSISVINNIIHIIPNNIDNKMEQCLTQYILSFKEQLQQWIIGLPGYNTKFNLNNTGYLSSVKYCHNGLNVYILYRLYYNNNIPILPAIVDIYYDKYSIQLNIHRWSLL